MLKANYKAHKLQFKFPAGTSRGVMHSKTSWFLLLERDDACASGIGECGLLQGLSPDDTPEYEATLQEVCRNIETYAHHPEKLASWPSIRSGLEMALLDMEAYRPRELFPSPFTRGQEGIAINGLIWMDDKERMRRQIDAKLEAGFSCIKLKIGAIEWQAELGLLQQLRKRYSAETLELRVDANGAFSPEEALHKLDALADLRVHSIEQPIKPGQWKAMERLSRESVLPVALDEELLGIWQPARQAELLGAIKPQYLILKPSLLGGFQAAQEWISLAEAQNIGWWVTSALESNIGLNALAQWTYTLENSMPQGLGTGQLYTNNFPSPLQISHGKIWHLPQQEWNLSQLMQTA